MQTASQLNPPPRVPSVSPSSIPPAPTGHASLDSQAQQVPQPLPDLSTVGDKEPQPVRLAANEGGASEGSPAGQRRLPVEGRDKPPEQGIQEARQALSEEFLGATKDDAPKKEDTAALPIQSKGEVLDEQPAGAGQKDLSQSHLLDSQVSGHSILATALQQLATSAKAAQEASNGDVAEEIDDL